MKSTSVRLMMSVLVFAVVGLSGACGSNSDTTTAGASSAATSTGSAPSPSAEPSTAGSADANGFCGAVQQQKALLQGSALTALLSNGTPDAWKSYLDKVTTMNQQLVDTAPAQIKADGKALQTTSLTLKSKLEAANYDVSKVGVTQLLQLLQAPEYKTAVANIVAYVKTACNIDLSTL